MVSAGTYVVSALALVAVGASVAFAAYRVRQKLLPAWTGAPGRLVEAVLAIALLIWLGETLGTLGLFYEWIYVAASVLLAVLAWTLLPGGGAVGGTSPEEASATGRAGGSPAATGPAGPATPVSGLGGRSVWHWLIAIGVIGLVVAHWGLTTKEALDRGIFNFDSLWYHLPFAVDMVQSHSTTALHYPETVFTNWFYPQNAELLHATGILLIHRDTLSLFLNFAFLGLAFLAAWCIGRPYARSYLTLVAAAIVLECHTLVVREPGAAKNDLVAAALLLAAAAILVTAWSRQRPAGLLRPVAVAGLAAGLAVGTKSTAVAMAAAMTLAVIVLAPRGRRWSTLGWWFVPALLGGGYWYLRNLIVAGNPLPQATGIGPISLPHPERLQEGRPNFNIVHYATDTGVWRSYFEPGLHQAFGALWPLVILAAVAGGLLALLRGRDAVLRWMGGVALFGLIAYLFTPLSAAGAAGAPVGFGINIRYAIPALLLALTLLPLGFKRLSGWREWTLLGVLLAVLVITNRSDSVARDPSRLFALALAILLVGLPTLGIWWSCRSTQAGSSAADGVGEGGLERGGGADLGDHPEEAAPAAPAAGGGAKSVTGPARPSAWSLVVACIAFALLILALGYPLQRHYLRDRFAAGSGIPGMHMEAAYRWARDKHDARIGLAGTTAGFLEYGLYGTDLSNRVLYLGEKGPHGAYNAIPTCKAFRTAVNAANLEYLVTAPFLNFLHPGDPIPSPEAGWLRNEPAAKPISKSGPVTIWEVQGKLNPSTCGQANSPLHRVPDTPKGGGQ